MIPELFCLRDIIARLQRKEEVVLGGENLLSDAIYCSEELNVCDMFQI